LKNHNHNKSPEMREKLNHRDWAWDYERK